MEALLLLLAIGIKTLPYWALLCWAAACEDPRRPKFAVRALWAALARAALGFAVGIPLAIALGDSKDLVYVATHTLVRLALWIGVTRLFLPRLRWSRIALFSVVGTAVSWGIELALFQGLAIHFRMC